MVANSSDAAAHSTLTSGDQDAHQPTGSDHTAQATGSEAPPNAQTNNSESAEPTMKLRSGYIVQKKWLTAQTELRRGKNSVGDSIRLQTPSPPSDSRAEDPSTTSDVSEGSSGSPPQIAPPKPMSDVFNIPELLEKILLNLETGFILHTAQKVCRGFKQSIDLSPTFLKRRQYAFKIDIDIDEKTVPRRSRNNPTYYQVNLRPSCLVRHTDNGRRSSAAFRFGGGTHPSFKSIAATEGLRNLRVFDKVPPFVSVVTHVSESSPRGHGKIVGKLSWVDEECEDLTFGRLLDAVARRNNADRVHSLWIIWHRHGREP